MPELSQLQSTAWWWDWVSYIALFVAFLGALSEIRYYVDRLDKITMEVSG